MQVSVRMEDDLVKMIDEYRKDADGLPSRPETVRRIVRAALRDWGELKKAFGIE